MSAAPEPAKLGGWELTQTAPYSDAKVPPSTPIDIQTAETAALTAESANRLTSMAHRPDDAGIVCASAAGYNGGWCQITQWA